VGKNTRSFPVEVEIITMQQLPANSLVLQENEYKVIKGNTNNKEEWL
jgi:hypothetical protein